jgi:hypothetical protein
LGIYGVYETRTSEANDGFYQEAVFMMMSDIEIFMYTLGASLPGTDLRTPTYVLEGATNSMKQYSPDTWFQDQILQGRCTPTFPPGPEMYPISFWQIQQPQGLSKALALLSGSPHSSYPSYRSTERTILILICMTTRRVSKL